MMHGCPSCPGDEALQSFLNEQLSEQDPDAEFHYSQWETTDRATLITVTTTCEEYKKTLISAINSLTKHSFLAKCQANFLKAKKDSLQKSEAIVLGDFAENFQFLIQDEIQSYHWSKEYCTLHPVVLYFIGNEGELQHKSFCIISDDNTHDTNFVYMVQKKVISYIQENLSHIAKIFYFSDGCAEQYKNRKNFINLCHHKQDFDIDAEWIFFATSHGKSPCDGVGGFVKRYVAKRSLQRPLKDQIVSYESMLDLCVSELREIIFYGISQDEMVPVRESLKERFSKSKTVPGTRSSHHFLPWSPWKIAHKLTSEDADFVQIFEFDKDFVEMKSISNVKNFSYVTCIYENHWWVGMISEVAKEEGDATVEFMHPHGPSKSFSWPAVADKCFVPLANILCSISSPITTTGRVYRISEEDYTKTLKAFAIHKN